MKKSRLEMPFSDFEDKVMLRIEKEAAHRKVVFKNARLSSFFFLLGTGFGLLLNFFLSRAGISFMGISSENILLFFQVAFVLAFLLQLEKIILMLKESRQ
jgi:drug/metabolite transporter (DMT)-like permease